MNDEIVLSHEVNLAIILRDILKNFWLIIMAALTVYIGTYVYKGLIYQPEYTTTATFVVSAKSSGYAMNVYSSLSTASEMAGVFREVFSSNVLKRIVSEELGEENVDFGITADVITDTNLLKISVTADSPKLSYTIIQAVINNYGEVSEYLFGYVVLNVLQSPKIPTAPSNSLSLRKYQVLGIMAAAVVMTGVIIFFSIFRRTVKTKEGAQYYLGERPLGLLVHEKKKMSLKERYKGKKKALLISNPIMSFRFVESYHKLAYKIQHKMEQKGQKILLVTGVGVNEGKSTVSSNLALALADKDKKVILVDMDLRRSAVHKIFEGSRKSLELADCLENPDILENLKYDNLLLITNRKLQGQPSEYIQSQSMNEFFAKLKGCADFVILDSAPLAIAADSELLTEYADTAALVVRQDETPIEIVNEAIRELEQSQSEYIGFIINDYRESFFGGKVPIGT